MVRLGHVAHFHLATMFCSKIRMHWRQAPD